MESELLENIKTKIDFLENSLKEIKIENQSVKENRQKLEVFKTSYNVLNKHKNHKLIKQEIIYQNYITKFSKAYVQFSSFYVGDSLIDYIINKPLQDYKNTLFSELLFYSFVSKIYK